jgi:curli biogenesis system outer membrane secretion channel CsgG
MKSRVIAHLVSFALLTSAAWVSSLAAQEQPAGLETIALSDIKVAPAIREATQKAGKLNEFARVVQSLDGQLTDALHNTRKFKIVATTDLADILKRQEFDGSGNVDLNSSGVAQRFKLAGVKYLVVPTINDYQDFEEKQTFEAMGSTLSRRVIRLAGVVRIYNSTTGVLLESANIRVTNQDVEELNKGTRSQGSLSDELLGNVAEEFAKRVAARVEDVIYPARVLAKTGKQVTFSRGDGSSVAVDQVWEVFARGEELIDPDTGASLGVEEVSVGKIRVNRVQPKFSTGMAIEDFGIEKGAILRPVSE